MKDKIKDLLQKCASNNIEVVFIDTKEQLINKDPDYKVAVITPLMNEDIILRQLKEVLFKANVECFNNEYEQLKNYYRSFINIK